MFPARESTGVEPTRHREDQGRFLRHRRAVHPSGHPLHPYRRSLSAVARSTCRAKHVEQHISSLLLVLPPLDPECDVHLVTHHGNFLADSQKLNSLMAFHATDARKHISIRYVIEHQALLLTARSRQRDAKIARGVRSFQISNDGCRQNHVRRLRFALCSSRY